MCYAAASSALSDFCPALRGLTVPVMGASSSFPVN